MFPFVWRALRSLPVLCVVMSDWLPSGLRHSEYDVSLWINESFYMNNGNYIVSNLFVDVYATSICCIHSFNLN